MLNHIEYKGGNMTYKELLLQDMQNDQKQLEWAKSRLEYEKAHVKRTRLSLMWAKVRIYGYEVGYNEIHKKQSEWCDRLWNIYTDQINEALDKMKINTSN